MAPLVAAFLIASVTGFDATDIRPVGAVRCRALHIRHSVADWPSAGGKYGSHALRPFQRNANPLIHVAISCGVAENCVRARRFTTLGPFQRAGIVAQANTQATVPGSGRIIQLASDYWLAFAPITALVPQNVLNEPVN